MGSRPHRKLETSVSYILCTHRCLLQLAVCVYIDSYTPLVFHRPAISSAGSVAIKWISHVHDPFFHTKHSKPGHVSLCVGGSKGKAGLQLKCIPEEKDTTELNPEESYAHNCWINL